MFFNTFDDFGNSAAFNTGATIDWSAIISRGFDLGSQAIAAWGRNPTTQSAYDPRNNSVFQLSPNQSGSYSSPYSNLTPQQLAALQSGGVGSTVGSGVDGIFNWLMSNPVITFGGLAALYLLFREPPRRR
jgi:hypothetical protein